MRALFCSKGGLAFNSISKPREQDLESNYFSCVHTMEYYLTIVYHGNIDKQLIQMGDGALKTEKIPATLMERFNGKGHTLYIDNYYTLMNLAKYFIDNGTNVTGTIRNNRKMFPIELKNTALEKGETAFYRHDSIVIAKYRSKRDTARKQPKVVYVLTTLHGANIRNTSRRDRDGNVIQKLDCIIDYNHYMG